MHEGLSGLEAARGDRPGKRSVGRVRVDARGIATPSEEQRDHARLVVVGGGEERSGAVGMSGIDEAWLGREHPAERRLVTAIDGAEELLDQLWRRVGGRGTRK